MPIQKDSIAGFFRLLLASLIIGTVLAVAIVSAYAWITSGVVALEANESGHWPSYGGRIDICVKESVGTVSRCSMVSILGRTIIDYFVVVPLTTFFLVSSSYTYSGGVISINSYYWLLAVEAVCVFIVFLALKYLPARRRKALKDFSNKFPFL